MSKIAKVFKVGEEGYLAKTEGMLDTGIYNKAM